MHSSHGISHILMNMLLLVIFGGHLERLWGMKRYFLFYMIAGVGAFGIGQYRQRYANG